MLNMINRLKKDILNMFNTEQDMPYWTWLTSWTRHVKHD
jgi:hypothetical protein